MISGVHFGDFWYDVFQNMRIDENSKNSTACRREHQNQSFGESTIVPNWIQTRIGNVMENRAERQFSIFVFAK